MRQKNRKPPLRSPISHKFSFWASHSAYVSASEMHFFYSGVPVRRAIRSTSTNAVPGYELQIRSVLQEDRACCLVWIQTDSVIGDHSTCRGIDLKKETWRRRGVHGLLVKMDQLLKVRSMLSSFVGLSWVVMERNIDFPVLTCTWSTSIAIFKKPVVRLYTSQCYARIDHQTSTIPWANRWYFESAIFLKCPLQRHTCKHNHLRIQWSSTWQLNKVHQPANKHHYHSPNKTNRHKVKVKPSIDSGSFEDNPPPSTVRLFPSFPWKGTNQQPTTKKRKPTQTRKPGESEMPPDRQTNPFYENGRLKETQRRFGTRCSEALNSSAANFTTAKKGASSGTVITWDEEWGLPFEIKLDLIGDLFFGVPTGGFCYRWLLVQNHSNL